MMPTPGLSMIVKDGASTLQQRLGSLGGLADTMVIGVTGSMDQAGAIAKSCDATVQHVSWRNDFAAARNQVLRELGTAGILTVDAGEKLDSQGHPRVTNAIAAPGVPARRVQVRNYLYPYQAPLADRVMLESGPTPMGRNVALLSEDSGQFEEALLHVRRAAAPAGAAPGAWLASGILVPGPGTEALSGSSELQVSRAAASVAAGAIEKSGAAARRVVEQVPTPRSIPRPAAVLSHSGNHEAAGEAMQYGLTLFPGSTVFTGTSYGEETSSHAAIC